MIHKQLYRVDIQVAIMTSCIVALSSALIFMTSYHISYEDMIESLQDRVSAIYYNIEDHLNPQDFTLINTKEDMELAAYQEIHSLLLEAKESTGVLYLYTAKALDDGTFVYVVDGLSKDSPDFRYPGDLIELEIQGDMTKALTAKIVMPDAIQDTSWGKIFIAYMPIIQDDEILGVIGIEFDAEHQYDTYQFLLRTMISMIVFSCLFASLISFKMFRRISNPTYKDLANTDMLCGLKSRNAFNTDLHNLNQKNKGAIALFSIDLDNLKVINDTYGHPAGDQYIISCVTLLQSALRADSILYRIGGDEFAIIMYHLQPNGVTDLVERIEVALKNRNEHSEDVVSFSVGHAIYDSTIDAHLMDTFQRADDTMYQLKRIKKAKIHSNIERRSKF